jgi:AMP-polyphosphate phosphotransferase
MNSKDDQVCARSSCRAGAGNQPGPMPGDHMKAQQADATAARLPGRPGPELVVGRDAQPIGAGEREDDRAGIGADDGQDALEQPTAVTTGPVLDQVADHHRLDQASLLIEQQHGEATREPVGIGHHQVEDVSDEARIEQRKVSPVLRKFAKAHLPILPRTRCLPAGLSTGPRLTRVGRLDEVDLTLRLTAKEEAKQLAEEQQRLLRLRLALGGQLGDAKIGPPLCIVFEGWDASGKGGAIKRLVDHLDPRHVRVSQFAAPTYDEKRHHFLWRFWPDLPGWGGMAVFDRSWYGRVLVERVEGFATKEQWRRAYDEIVGFETTLAAEGMIIVKFWMHLSSREQLRRFNRRADDPLRQWKLTDEDIRNRRKRKAYKAAVEEMLARTDHPAAPWNVVPGEDKRYARVAVVRKVCDAIEATGFKAPEI